MLFEGIEFLFDDCDLPIARGYDWRVFHSDSDKPRLARQEGRAATLVNIYIYQQILAPIPVGMVVDHINGDTRDNRRRNLRICTQAQNRANARPRLNKRIPYKGVGVVRGKFTANIMRANGRAMRRSFDTAADAARAYDALATAEFGEFAWLNAHHFPELAHTPEQDHV